MHYTLENTPLAVQRRSQSTVRRADYSISLQHNDDDDGGVLQVTWKPVGTDDDEFVELKIEVMYLWLLMSLWAHLFWFCLCFFRFKMEKVPTFRLGSVLAFCRTVNRGTAAEQTSVRKKWLQWHEGLKFKCHVLEIKN